MRCIPLLLIAFVAGAAIGHPSVGYTITDSLHHRWSDEVVGFDFDVKSTARQFTLVDADDRPIPCDVTNLTRKNGRARGRITTVVSLGPGQTLTLFLRPDAPPAVPLPIRESTDSVTLVNDRITLSLPRLPGKLATPMPLTKLSAPIRSIGREGRQYGAGSWQGADALLVKEATTRIVERGCIRATVEQHYILADNREYTMTVQLALRQDAALITENATIHAPEAGFRFDFTPNLQPKRVLWHNQWKSTPHAKTWEQVDTDLTTIAQPAPLCILRPWSFWWEGDITPWAGCYAPEGDIVGVIMLRPSRWTPYVGDSFSRTQMTVTAGGGQAYLTAPFIAAMKDATVQEKPAPLHREWALTVGKANDRIDAKGIATLRRQLIKYGEFPLDEVKEYTRYFPPKLGREHPFLLLTPVDLARVRAQVRDLPAAKAVLQPNVDYVLRCLGTRYEREGWESVYDNVFWGNGLTEMMPEAYLASDNPALGWGMASAAKGYARDLRRLLLEAPNKPAIGAQGPWVTDSITRLLFAYDLLADTDYLTADEKADIRATLVLGGVFLKHPDFWNVERGLCSGNPNMTVAILLPQGLLGLGLEGHPRAADWLKGAEAELNSELSDYIDANGAWIECPGYQSASLDAMFILMQALRNGTGRDYFNDSRFKKTMDYYGFLQTPPDWRFPPKRTAGVPACMTVPTIGDTPAGFVHCFNGWIAKVTEKTDPTFSARQQFFWQGQLFSRYRAGRGAGYLPAMTDYALPAAPPAKLSDGFPGFGSVLRTSWADPNAAYVAHRTGPFSHHYHDDYGSIIFFAKGAPLVMDFGNQYNPVRREEAYYHSRVSFDIASSPQHFGSTGQLVEVSTLPQTMDYSHGKTTGGGGQVSDRHLLLVKSPDTLGANYLVMRDTNTGGPAGQRFYWNLWCLATGIDGFNPDGTASVLHFPGQHIADLDVHFVQPSVVKVTPDKWSWHAVMNIAMVYIDQAEEMPGVHAWQDGANQDFLTVLYPRTKGEKAATVTALANGAGAKVTHSEGTDWVLLSPAKAQLINTDDVELRGEIAFARHNADGSQRLAVMNGAASRCGWMLQSNGCASLTVTTASVTGESSGPAHTVIIGVPGGGTLPVLLDGKPLAVKRNGDAMSIDVPAGDHVFTLVIER